MPPTTRALKADHVRRWAGAAADAAELASRSFDCWHISPLPIGLGSLLMGNRKQNFDSFCMNAPTYYLKLQGEFRRLHGLGWTFRQMADALGVSERTISAWRAELDLPRRPRGRRPRESRKVSNRDMSGRESDQSPGTGIQPKSLFPPVPITDSRSAPRQGGRQKRLA
jgi:hypothetical protein